MQQSCNYQYTINEWLQWLTDDRCISVQVAEQAGLRFSDRGVKIPIRDEHGKVIFNKYRRAPWTHDGPKYSYEKGARAYLYGADLIRDVDTVYITEGEFDALVLRSIGYYAVTSTGGASTFSPEWATLLSGKTVVLCYDADAAGVKGALRVVDILKKAHIAFVPWGYGKDITDVVRAGQEDKLDFALKNAVAITNEWKKAIDILKTERVRFIQQYITSPAVVDMYIDGVYSRIQEDKPIRRSSVSKDTDKIVQANSYPIRKLLKVNGSGFAQCISGCKDKTWSMKVYKDNHAYAFCCGKRHDAISIYRLQHPDATFSQTLDALV